MRLRAVAYVRVSTKEQDEDVQVAAIREFAEKRGFQIVGWYIDKGESGAKPFSERPGAQRMMLELERTSPDVVLAWSLDRLGRSMLDTLNAITKLESSGVRVVTVKEEWLQTIDDNVRRLILSILSWVAEFERKRIRERQEEAWRQGKQKGRPKRVPDSVLLDYLRRYSRISGYGAKKYIWLRLREDGYDISYDTFRKRIKQLTKKKSD